MSISKEILSDEEISHSLSDAHLKEAAEARAEQQNLKERTQKLEQTRSSVSEAVFKKVWSDYQEKMKGVVERLTTLKKELETDVRSLTTKKATVEASIKLHKERKEESDLRHTLGELTDDEHQKILQSEDSEIVRLESAFQKLDEDITHHRMLFEGIESSTVPAPQPPAKAMNTGEKTAKLRIDESTDSLSVAKGSAPAKPAELQVLENGKVVQKVPIDKTIVIGRSPANDVVLKEAKVSRRHAEIQWTAGKYILIDLESSNGTFVGGKKITEQALQAEDQIVIGNTKMVFKA